MNNIILIGMPGSGKSTLGVLLAKAMSYDFLDTDIVIQKRCKNKLFKIIENEGIDAFLQLENKILSEINVDNTVVATGGSAIFGAEAMENLKKDSVVVYIKLGCEELKKRITNITTRGIVMKPGKTLEDIYEERYPLYEKYADMIIEADNTSVEQALQMIIQKLTN